MIQASSTMPALGIACPDFALPDVTSGDTLTRSSVAGRPLLIVFVSTRCPSVAHVASELTHLGRDVAASDLAMVAIGANDAHRHPEEGPTGLATLASRAEWCFPVCHDATQETAKAFEAACSPDVFLYDRRHRLVYRGRIDAARPDNEEPVNGADLRAAITATLSDQPASRDQLPSLGSAITWEPGNAPEWFGR